MKAIFEAVYNRVVIRYADQRPGLVLEAFGVDSETAEAVMREIVRRFEAHELLIAACKEAEESMATAMRAMDYSTRDVNREPVIVHLRSVIAKAGGGAK